MLATPTNVIKEQSVYAIQNETHLPLRQELGVALAHGCERAQILLYGR